MCICLTIVTYFYSKVRTMVLRGKIKPKIIVFSKTKLFIHNHKICFKNNFLSRSLMIPKLEINIYLRR